MAIATLIAAWTAALDTAAAGHVIIPATNVAGRIVVVITEATRTAGITTWSHEDTLRRDRTIGRVSTGASSFTAAKVTPGWLGS